MATSEEVNTGTILLFTGGMNNDSEIKSNNKKPEKK
jgi:hypothetical protein